MYPFLAFSPQQRSGGEAGKWRAPGSLALSRGRRVVFGAQVLEVGYAGVIVILEPDAHFQIGGVVERAGGGTANAVLAEIGRRDDVINKKVGVAGAQATARVFDRRVCGILRHSQLSKRCSVLAVGGVDRLAGHAVGLQLRWQTDEEHHTPSAPEHERA